MNKNNMADADILERAREFIEEQVKQLPLPVKLNGITVAEKEEAASMCAEFAASELARQSGWVAYPETQPLKEGHYLVTYEGGYLGTEHASINEPHQLPEFPIFASVAYFRDEHLEPFQEADNET